MDKKYIYLIIILLIISCLAAFGRIAGNDFINYNDPLYITENYHVQSGMSLENIKWAFTADFLANWHPVTWLSYMLDWSLFGVNASGYHLVSLVLHIGAVIFLFLFLSKTTNNIWPAAFAAALFALHPLRVESVAWASERKDVLSMFFGMAALYVYAFYAESSRLSRYVVCLVLFALSLMSKPMLVTLPFILLLLDYWPLGRWQKAWNPVHMPSGNGDLAKAKRKGKRSQTDNIAEQKKTSRPLKGRYRLIGALLWEKVPFCILVIFSIGLTLWAQRQAIAPLDKYPFTGRVMNSVLSYLSYLLKFIYPIDLAAIYPYHNIFPLWEVSIYALLLLGISMAVIYTFKKAPFLFIGWFWYLGTLIPVIGLVQVGRQAMADRYTYLPSIGIAIMLAWGIPLLFHRENIRKKISFPAVAILLILAALTWNQCGYWKNSIELFSHTLRLTKDNYVANINRGRAYAETGQYQLAIEDFNEAIHLKTDYESNYKDNYVAHHNRGLAYDKLGQYQLAIEDYSEAIHLEPDFYQSYYARGTLYAKHGQYQQSVEDFNKAISLSPDNIKAYNNRGIVYSQMGIFQKALEDFNEAIRLKSDYADAYNNRAFIYLKHENKERGCDDAKKACELGNCKTWAAAKGGGLCR